jgi:SAM-dependent methyltransferase
LKLSGDPGNGSKRRQGAHRELECSLAGRWVGSSGEGGGFVIWDERYSQPGFAYGDEPNEFLVSAAGNIPAGGRVLCLGEGEGRNAVFLGGLGHRVVAVDRSAVGLAKARQLAEVRGVAIETVQADLARFAIEPGTWAGIVSIFCHLPTTIRVPLHQAVVEGLSPGGAFILEAYTPAQLGRGTGGPTDADMLPSLAALSAELAGLEFSHALELEREVREGRYHTGRAAVVQVIGHRQRDGAAPDRASG